MSVLQAQIYTPSGTIQGSSGNNSVGLNISTPAAQLHIYNRNDLGLLLDAGVGGALPGGGYSSTSFPLQMRYSDPNVSPALEDEVRFRMHNTGRLDLGSDFSGYNTFANNRLNLRFGLQVFSDAETYSYLNPGRLRWSGQEHFHLSYYDESGSSDLDILSIRENGRVGFGALPGEFRFRIYNTEVDDDLLSITKDGHVTIQHFNTPNGEEDPEGVYGLTVRNDGFRAHDFAFQVESVHGPVFSVANEGHVLIGVQGGEEPEINKSLEDHELYSLYVARGIRTERVRVDVATENGWADYVFEEGYQMMSLEELEQYIKQHGHLPGVPSAKEVAEDGIDLAEMNKILLEKIEEQSLMLISLNKKLESFEKKNKK